MDGNGDNHDGIASTSTAMTNASAHAAIHPRRYFYPLISDFPMYRGLPSAHGENLPVATVAAQQTPLLKDLSRPGHVCS